VQHTVNRIQKNLLLSMTRAKGLLNSRPKGTTVTPGVIVLLITSSLLSLVL
jgi:hypothetical protein